VPTSLKNTDDLAHSLSLNFDDSLIFNDYKNYCTLRTDGGFVTQPVFQGVDYRIDQYLKLLR
jgi:hypothetical protein